MSKTDQILVYHHLAAGAPIIPNNLAIITRSDLESILSAHPDLQKTTKTIPRGATLIAIHQRDLLTASQVSESEGEGAPNLEANVAAVQLPVRVVLGRALAGWWGEMVVLSRKVGDRGA